MSRPMYYKLEGHKAVPIANDNAMEWATAWRGDRNVAKDQFKDVRVSTVFLGLDHGYGDEPPLLFETMIFGGEHDDYQKRYSTWEEAEAGNGYQTRNKMRPHNTSDEAPELTGEEKNKIMNDFLLPPNVLEQPVTYEELLDLLLAVSQVYELTKLHSLKVWGERIRQAMKDTQWEGQQLPWKD